MRTRKWTRISLVLTLALALFLSACGGSGTTPPSTAPSTPAPGSAPAPKADPNAPVKGGIFKAAVPANAPTLDVMTTVAAATRQASWLFVESLVAYSEDYQIKPLLAEKWEASPDGKVYTFTLRKGVKFHNGKEMTAEDVLASAERFMKVSPKKAQFNIEKVEAKDPYTVVFTTKAVNSEFLAALASPAGYMAIMPKEIIAGKEANKLELKDQIGTGPYQLVEWKPDQIIRFKRFEDYKAQPGKTDGYVGNKTPYFDEVHILPVPEAGARLAGLQAGEYDYVEGINPSSWDELKGNPTVALLTVKPLRWITIDFNHGSKWGKNLNFRKAVQAALDHEAIMKAVTNGNETFYRIQPSIYFNESPFHTEVRKELFNQKNMAKVQEHLKAAGYNGEEIIMLTNKDYDYMYKTILTASEQLKKAGFNVKVEVREWTAQRAMWNKTEGWDLDVTSFLSQALFAPSDFSTIWGCSAKRKFYCNQELDSLYKKAQTTLDLNTRKQIYADIQRLYYEDVASIKVGDHFGLEAVNAKVRNFAPWYAPRLWNIWKSK